VDVRLSAEQQALRESAARIVDQLGPRAVGELDDAERSAKLDAAVDASGWRELRVGDEDGAPLASGVETAIVAEELGRGLADVSFLGPTLAAELRRLAGAAPSGSVETVVLTADLVALADTTDGAAPLVAIDTQGSTRALLVARGPDGNHLARVDLPPDVVGIDLTRPCAALPTSRPGSSEVSAHHPISDDDLVRWAALGLSLTCADLVGVMRGAVKLATDYATQRRQYGASIGSFQAVQHMLADAFVVMEGSHSVALHAAWAVDALTPLEAMTAASTGKAYCARAARDVCETAIQVHGGIGNTWDCLAHVYLRRALLSSDILGGAGISLERVLKSNGIGA
jgi:alkylation response protein AidB-like acyl-CoA dehydrogenase